MRSLYLPLGLMAIVCALFCFGTATAAEFSPTLDYQLNQAKPGEFVSAIVILESPIDIRALDQRLHVEKATKARRHAEVLSALHYNADQTQPRIKAEFDQAVAEGKMQGYTPYWIEDLFVIYATKDYILSLKDRGDIKYVTENFQAVLIDPIIAPERGRDGNDKDPFPVSGYSHRRSHCTQRAALAGNDHVGESDERVRSREPAHQSL